MADTATRTRTHTTADDRSVATRSPPPLPQYLFCLYFAVTLHSTRVKQPFPSWNHFRPCPFFSFATCGQSGLVWRCRRRPLFFLDNVNSACGPRFFVLAN
nr:hypothetical protein [Pandoravirus massiliensis]